MKQDRNELRNKALKAEKMGACIADIDRIDIHGDLVLGNNIEIDVNVIFKGRVEIKDNVSIGPNCILTDCTIGSGTTIHPFSMIEESIIGEHSFVGPYGRVRPGTFLANNVQIGNFVEIKNSNIGANCRINHFTYLGDAVLKSDVTIGAGTITCNYDGIKKHKTIIEQGAFIGSGCNLIAPVTTHKNTFFRG